MRERKKNMVRSSVVIKVARDTRTAEKHIFIFVSYLRLSVVVFKYAIFSPRIFWPKDKNEVTQILRKIASQFFFYMHKLHKLVTGVFFLSPPKNSYWLLLFSWSNVDAFTDCYYQSRVSLLCKFYF